MNKCYPWIILIVNQNLISNSRSNFLDLTILFVWMSLGDSQDRWGKKVAKQIKEDKIPASDKNLEK